MTNPKDIIEKNLRNVLNIRYFFIVLLGCLAGTSWWILPALFDKDIGYGYAATAMYAILAVASFVCNRKLKETEIFFEELKKME